MEAPIGVTIFAKDADPLGPNLNTHQNGPSFDDKSRENRLMSYTVIEKPILLIFFVKFIELIVFNRKFP